MDVSSEDESYEAIIIDSDDDDEQNNSPNLNTVAVAEKRQDGISDSKLVEIEYFLPSQMDSKHRYCEQSSKENFTQISEYHNNFTEQTSTLKCYHKATTSTVVALERLAVDLMKVISHSSEKGNLSTQKSSNVEKTILEVPKAEFDISNLNPPPHTNLSTSSKKNTTTRKKPVKNKKKNLRSPKLSNIEKTILEVSKSEFDISNLIPPRHTKLSRSFSNRKSPLRNKKKDLKSQINFTEEKNTVNEIVPSEFATLYNKIFDDNVENLCTKMGELIFLVMKEEENYSHHLKSAEKITCKQMQEKEGEICRSSFLKTCEEYKKSFTMMFQEMVSIIHSNVSSVKLQKTFFLAWFIKVFLKITELSSELSDCLTVVWKKTTDLLTNYDNSLPVVKEIFSLNEIEFEKDCWQILDLLIKSSSTDRGSGPLNQEMAITSSDNTHQTCYSKPNLLPKVIKQLNVHSNPSHTPSIYTTYIKYDRQGVQLPFPRTKDVIKNTTFHSRNQHMPQCVNGYQCPVSRSHFNSHSPQQTSETSHIGHSSTTDQLITVKSITENVLRPKGEINQTTQSALHTTTKNNLNTCVSEQLNKQVNSGNLDVLFAKSLKKTGDGEGQSVVSENLPQETLNCEFSNQH